MARSTSRTSTKSNERDAAHIVEIVVPLGGLGKSLDAIYDFHARHHISRKAWADSTRREWPQIYALALCRSQDGCSVCEKIWWHD